MPGKEIVPVAHCEPAAAAPVEEEEEDEGPVDIKEAVEEKCLHDRKCAPALHHFEECAKRVEGGEDEDCTEEFFHLRHCVDALAAPKIFAPLV